MNMQEFFFRSAPVYNIEFCVRACVHMWLCMCVYYKSKNDGDNNDLENKSLT